jgi:hypothetical protein
MAYDPSSGQSDRVEGYGFAPNTTLTLTINGTPVGDPPTTDTGGNLWYQPPDLNLASGDVVEVSDGTQAKSLTLVGLTFDTLDYDADTATGTSNQPDGTEVQLWIGDSTGNEGGQAVTAVSGGVWTVTLGFDVVYGWGGQASIFDADGDDTFADSPTPDSSLVRVGGDNRFETAILLSKLAYPDAGSAGAVVLSRSDLFPDALSGGPLAAAVDGPVLITPSSELRVDVLAEIERVLPTGETVYVLGSYDALSAGVESALVAAGYQTIRFAGANRFETSLLIAEEIESVAGSPQILFVATGLNYPDALAAGAAAASFNLPEYEPDVPTSVVVLSRDYTLTPPVEDYLADIYLTDPESIIVAAGGQASSAVSDAFGCNDEQGCFYYEGANRYQTAAWIADDWFEPYTGFGLTTGRNFPDALTGSPVLGGYNWPVLLVPPDGPIPSRADYSVREFLVEYSSSLNAGLVLGSTASVSSSVATEVCQLTGITNCDVPFVP